MTNRMPCDTDQFVINVNLYIYCNILLALSKTM